MTARKYIAIRGGTGLGATMLSSSVVQSTGWPLERWMVHPRRESPPSGSLGVVELYLHDGKWHAWESGCPSAIGVDNARRLAVLRNGEVGA